ncbi:MAG TPA: NTP transferase domain-containing protein [Streptosporangiaceae bacterium]|jgi:molybdopterin-guanine dinucleotide biosynthesis protein A|nr:NTP transferase domain-containing protein [Streptosporangiaceae bacterium]
MKGNQRATPPSFGMIVLAGGRGARLGGADKPGLTVGNRTLLASVVSAGTDAGARQVIIVGPYRPDIEVQGTLCFVREEPPGAGPVPALRCGLAELGAAPLAAVLAADLPFLRPEHIRALVSAAADGGAVLVDDEGRAQWLAGCWRTDVLRRAAGAYAGSSLHGLLEPLQPVKVRIRPEAGQPPPWLDCDTEEDLRRARDWHARLAGQGAPPGTTTLRSGSPAANRRTCWMTNWAAAG